MEVSDERMDTASRRSMVEVCGVGMPDDGNEFERKLVTVEKEFEKSIEKARTDVLAELKKKVNVSQNKNNVRTTCIVGRSSRAQQSGKINC
jgi:hypothetical protein